MKACSSIVAILAAILIPVGSSHAQKQIRLEPATPVAEQDAIRSDEETRGIHITDDLFRSPEGQAALRNFLEAKESGQLEMRKTGAGADTIGTRRDFNVLTNIRTDSSTWEGLNFTLRAANAVANVWVETRLDGTFSHGTIVELEGHILSATPSASFRPDRGIIENDNYVFGMPPNFDGDGKVDILLYDIIEGNDDCCIMGYVHATDINPLAPAGQGNKADVLHVDLPDGMSRGVINVAGTIAHEYQHLIHLAYQSSGFPEWAFVNEGLSEWAEVINGYFSRTISYLQNTDEHNTPLLGFRYNESIEVVVNDYQRAGLFTTYLAERLGLEATGSIVQARPQGSNIYAVGAPGYELVLQQAELTLADVVADFHTANIVNNQAVEPRFGYGIPQRRSVMAVPTTSFDGRAHTTSSGNVFVSGGAVHYVSWTNVQDLNIGIADRAQDLPNPRAQTAFRVFAEPTDGPHEVVELEPSATQYVAQGSYERVTLLIVNTNASVSQPAVSYTVTGSWALNVTEETIAYENGSSAGQPYFTLQESSIQASVFVVPETGRLKSVHVAPVYTNQFTAGGEPILPPGLPRDFRVHVWATDGAGFPGEELYHLDVTDDPSGTHINFQTREYTFMEVELPDNESVLSALPDSIFIGMSNTGADENYLALTSATYIGEETGDLSFLYYEFSNGAGWAPFSAITSGGEPVLQGRVLPIRAGFLIPAGEQDPSEPPVFTATPPTDTLTVDEGETVTFDFNADPRDPGETVTFSLANAPAFASISAQTGVFTASPGFAGAGIYDIGVVASDVSFSTTFNLTLVVREVIRVTPTPGDTTVADGQTMTIDFNVANPNPADPVTWGLTEAVANASINATTGVFTFTPSFEQVGGTFTFTVFARNSTDSVTVSFHATVVADNLYGDANLNGKVTALDGSIILQHAAGSTTLTGKAFSQADVSGNSDVSAFDASLVLQFVTGIIDSFPVEEAGKTSLAIASGDPVWGEIDIVRETSSITVPISLKGNVKNVYAVEFSAGVDLELVNFKAIAAKLPEDWQISHSFDKEAGTLKVAMAGTTPLEDEGVIANVTFEHLNRDSEPVFRGEGSVNENAKVALGEIKAVQLPTEFSLGENYPNPFNPTTTINYALPQKANVVLEVYDVAGRLVQTLVLDEKEAGRYTIKWDGRNAAGAQVASGLYVYRIKAGSFVEGKTMLLVK